MATRPSGRRGDLPGRAAEEPGRHGLGGSRWLPGRPGERGSGSMLVVSVLLVLLVVGAVLVWQAGWVAAGARARSVADLVALAAARAQQSGIPACQVAEVVAAENAALLAGCTVTTGWGEFVVDITIEMVLVPQVVGGPRTVSAESRAGVIHDQA